MNARSLLADSAFGSSSSRCNGLVDGRHSTWGFEHVSISVQFSMHQPRAISRAGVGGEIACKMAVFRWLLCACCVVLCAVLLEMGLANPVLPLGPKRPVRLANPGGSLHTVSPPTAYNEAR